MFAPGFARYRLSSAVPDRGILAIALGTLPTSACGPFDVNGDHLVTVDEIVRAVGLALSGCTAAGAS